MKSTYKQAWFLILFLGAMLLGGRTGYAQAVFGSIVGTVTDATGAVVPTATVTVTDTAKGTSQTVQTNSSGNYTASRLIPDSYSVKVEAAGFSPSEVKNIAIAADTTQQVNLQMQVSGAQQTVTVTTGAPPLQTDSSDVGQVITAKQLQELPNVNRNFSSFALLAPGVQRSNSVRTPTENPMGTVGIVVNGSNYGELGYMLDGTDNREPVLGDIVVNPTLDSISETKVDTQNFPAEFGGALAGVVSAQTRSGSNSLHGDVFLYRRSDALEARDPYTQFQRDPVTHRYIPSSLYSQFGGSIGGPILKDKAFFFGDYQGTRQRVGTSLLQSVPTAQVRNTCLNASSATCDLSQYGGGVISSTLVTPQGRALLSALPAPNTGAVGTTSNNYAGSGTGQFNGDQADIRLDGQITANMHTFARYDYAKYRLSATPVFGAAGGLGFGLGNTAGNDQGQNQSAAAGLDWAIRTNLLTDLRFGFLNYRISNNKFDAGTTPALNIGLPNLNTGAPGTDGSPDYVPTDGSVSSFGAVGTSVCNCPLRENEKVFQIANNWTKIFGNHEVRFGADLRYALNTRNASNANRSGHLVFNNTTGAGSGLGAILEGQIANFQRYDVYAVGSDHQKRGGFYAQDTWRVTPKFTLNYGVRWDIIFPETADAPGHGGYTDLQAGVIRVVGVGGVPLNGGEKLDLLDLGGRLGFAYQAHPGTVVRGAFGQVYDDVGFFASIYGTVLTQNVPVTRSENVGSASGSQSVYTYATLPARAPQATIPANGLIPILPGIVYFDRGPRLILPRVNQYNLSLQQQVNSNMTFTIAYVGNIADRIYPGETGRFNINQPVLPTSPADLKAKDPATPAPCTPGSAAGCSRNQRRPYYDRFSQPYEGALQICCSQDITSVAPKARSNYNSLQASIEQRFAGGLQLQANYTWSRALNYGTTYFAHDPRVEYGPSETNRNNVFVLSGIYELPFGQNKMFANTTNRLLNYAVGGWQLAGSTTWESGLPFTPTYQECGSVEDVDTNFGNPGGAHDAGDCRPNKLGSGQGNGFTLHTGAYNPATHSRRYFTPVAPLATPGTVSGPFVAPAFGTIGNIGKNSFRGPSDYFADASLFKNFSITERVKGQFQLQAFNVFNHAPLGLPSATNARCVDCTTNTTGLITGVDSALSASGQPYMRQLQFGARFTF